jgi:voltage-gated potassium channel
MIIGYGIIAVPTGIVSAEMAKASIVPLKPCRACSNLISPPHARFCSNCGKEQSQTQEQMPG